MQYLITGETYLLRREIKSFWAFWNRDNKGWVVKEKTEQLEKFVEENSLELEALEKEIQKTARIDVLIDKAERKIEMYENRILKAKNDFKELDKKHDRLTHGRDYAFITQPCNWHRWMIKAKQKVEKVFEDKYWKGWAIDRQDAASDKLDYWKAELKRLQDKKAWKWKNAKQRTEELIEYNRERFKKWDFVKTCRWSWKITKMNKKTCRIEWMSYNISIQYIS